MTDSFQISWYDRFPAQEHVQAGLATHAVTLSAAVGGGHAPAASVPVAASLVVASTSERPAPTPVPDKSNRVKYSCSCSINVWGKPALRLQCLDCGNVFTPGGKPKDGNHGWEDLYKDGVFLVPDGTHVEMTVTDDTLTGGAAQVTRTFVAPFARANREEDYRTAWAFFEAAGFAP